MVFSPQRLTKRMLVERDFVGNTVEGDSSEIETNENLSNKVGEIKKPDELLKKLSFSSGRRSFL